MSKFFDTQLEKRSLAAMIHNVDALEHASKYLLPEDFDNKDASYLFERIIAFYHRYYKPLTRDIISKWFTLHDPKKKTDIMMLYSEIDAMPADDYSRYYMNELKSFTIKRKLFNVHDMITEGLNNNDDPKILYDSLTKKIITGHSSEVVTRTTVYDDVESRIRLYEDKRDNPEKYKGVQYGFEEVDELTGGMFSGQLYMIMGRTGAGKCAKFDSKILMLDGSLETIENIVKNKDSRKILTMDNNHLIDMTPTNYMYSGKQQVYKVITKTGRIIELTKTHPLYTVNGWKSLQDIKEGDRLAVPRTMPVFGKSTLSTAQVKLLAYLIAEGNLSTHSIGFTNYDLDIRKDFRDTVKYSGIEGTSVKTHGYALPKNKRTLVITGSVLDKEKTEYGTNKFRRLSKNPVKEWLNTYNLLGKKAVDKQIPAEIFKLPEANLAKFLGVLWSCDGSIYGDKLHHITFETGSPDLTKDVAHLLLRFGILTRYWEHYTICNGKKFIIGSLEVIGSCRQKFLEKIGPHFIGAKTKTVTEALKLVKTSKLNTNVDTIPMDLVISHLPRNNRGAIDRKKIKDVGIKFEFNYSKDWAKYGICRNKVLLLAEALQNVELYHLATNDIFWDTVKTIEKGEIVDTYDLEMSPTSNFIVNDVLIHNSRMLFNIGCNVAATGKSVMYCTIEMEAKIIQHMYESRQAEIPLQNVLRAQMTPPEQDRYIDFLRDSEQLQVPFYIVDIPQGCTTGMIDSEVHMFEKIHGHVPDLVLIDYANLINPVSKYKDRAEKYDHVFREFKEGSRANKTIYYTAAQMNRESTKTKEPGTEHVAFSDASSYHCDAIFRVFADQASEADDDIQFEVIKGRYHGKACVSLYWNRELNLIRSWGKAELKSRLEKGEENVTEDSSTIEPVPGSDGGTKSVAEELQDY